MGLKKAKVFTVTSVKGGTGKTTTLLNLAGIFSKMNKKILILDFDLYSGAIALSLNIPNEQDIYQLMDDLNSNRFKMIDPYLVKYNENIDVLSSPKDPRQGYDIILIDTNYFLNDITLIALDASDEILYILEGDPIDLKSMATRLTIHKDMEKENYKIILNEARTKDKEHFSKSDIKL